MSASASTYSDDDDALIADINVTPLVDVVLVLLIVFMITMPTIVRQDVFKERELEVVLPQASEAMPLTAIPREVFVNIDNAGRYTVKGVPKNEQELLKSLEQAAADNPAKAIVVIRADKRCPWQFVVNVMNLCNKAKIRNYRVSTAE
ncbi:MAG TPA: biopolymer transporter ExbD [Pirellulales bacterium]|nr:biopolymer transporter ExbD [Pirellulales bacterium]